MTISDIREKVKEIQKEVIKYDSKSKAGNQNCLLCAWVVEAYFRGVDILPRPVYSPRDIIFKKNGYDIIKDPIKIQIKNKNDVIRIIKNAGDESRFYIHVKWSASTQGGHEFNLINLNSKIYLIDGQAGLVCLINSKSAIIYFDGIDFSNSYMVRLDDKEFNQSILKYNKMKYLIMWDDSKDIPYITKQDLVSESALSSKSIDERVNDMDTSSFDIVMEFLSKKDEEYFDSKIPDVEKSITEAKNYIKKFYAKKKTLDTYLKNNPDAKDEDNSLDVDKEYEKGLTLYSNAIKELYSAQKCIEINLVPENKGTLSKVHTASTIAMVMGFVYFILTLMIRKDKTSSIEVGVGLGLTGIGGVISNKTENVDYRNKWKEKLAEYKQKKNLSVWESLELVERQIKDLIRDFENKYPFYNKR